MVSDGHNRLKQTRLLRRALTSGDSYDHGNPVASKPDKGTAILGRPRLADGKRRDTLVRVLCMKRELEELRRAADEASMSVSAWVRITALNKARARSAIRRSRR